MATHMIKLTETSHVLTSCTLQFSTSSFVYFFGIVSWEEGEREREGKRYGEE